MAPPNQAPNLLSRAALLVVFFLAVGLLRDAARAASAHGAEIEEVSGLPVPFGDPAALAGDGQRMYLANGAGGLVILDAADPLHPAVIGRFLTGSATAASVAFSRENSSDPAAANSAPGAAGSEGWDGIAVGVAVSGKSVFLLTANRSSGRDFTRVLNLDISIPARPQLAAQIRLSGRPRALAALSPTRVCVAIGADSEQSGSLVFADLSGTTGARLAASLPYPSADLDAYFGLAYAQETLLVCGSAIGGPGHLDVVDCGEPDHPLPGISLATRGEARDVVTGSSGLVGYVADGDQGIAVVDVSNRQSPQVQETPVPVEGAALHVSLAQKSLLVTSRAGLALFNLTNPLRPVRQTPLRTAFVPGAAALGEGYAAVIAPQRGVEFYQLGMGADVREGRLIATAGSPPRIRRSGEDLYAALGMGGCVHYSARGAEAPVEVGNLELQPGSKGEVTDAVPVGGRSFWSAAGGAGILVSALAGSFAARVGDAVTGGGERALAADGNRVYAANETGTLRIYDAADAHRPLLLGTVNYSPSEHSCGCAIAAARGRAYVAAGSGGLVILDVSDPRVPRVLGQLTADRSGPLRCIDVVVAGSIAYLVSEGRGLLCVDVADAAHPRILADYPARQAGTVDVSGGLALLSEGTLGLEAVDVTDPARPVSAGGFHGRGLRFSSAVWGTANGSTVPIYAGDGGFLRTLRLHLRSPRETRAEQVATAAVPGLAGLAVGSAVDQHRLLLAGADYHLFFIELTPEEARKPVVRCMHTDMVSAAPCAGFAVGDAKAYFWDAGGSVVRTLDLPELGLIAGPAPPIGTMSPVPGRLLFGAVRDRKLFQPAGGRVLDLADPFKPALLGACRGVGSGDAASAFTSQHGESYWLIADTAGLEVVDVNDPAHPHLIGTAPLLRTPRSRGIEVVGTHVLVLARDQLCVVDLTAPRHPRLTASLSLPGLGYDLRVEGNLAYVACGIHGVLVVDVQDPTQPYPIQLLDTEGNSPPPDYRLLELAEGNLYAVAAAPTGTTIEVWKLASRSH